MTNEQAKQEAVKMAYGEWFEKAHPDENGWIRNFTGTNAEVLNLACFNDHLFEMRSQNFKTFFRLKTLKGIEDNNGWVKIEADLSNFPSQTGIYTFLLKPHKGRQPAPITRLFEVGISSKVIMSKHFSHWRNQDDLPLY